MIASAATEAAAGAGAATCAASEIGAVAVANATTTAISSSAGSAATSAAAVNLGAPAAAGAEAFCAAEAGVAGFWGSFFAPALAIGGVALGAYTGYKISQQGNRISQQGQRLSSLESQMAQPFLHLSSMNHDDVKDMITCPIKQDIIDDPVWLVQDNRLYERSELQRHYDSSRNRTSPVSGVAMPNPSNLPTHAKQKDL